MSPAPSLGHLRGHLESWTDQFQLQFRPPPRCTAGPIDDAADGIGLAADWLSRSCRAAVLTLGRHGAITVGARGESQACTPAPAVAAVIDTVGAGDAFCGTFMAAYMRGAPLAACAAAGCEGGAAAVQCAGAALPPASIARLRATFDRLIADAITPSSPMRACA